MQPQASPSMKRRSLSASSILQPNRPPVSSPASGTHVQFANEPPRTYHHQQQPSYSSQSYQPPGYYSSPYNNSNGQPSAPPPPPPQSSAQTQGSPYMRSRRQESNPDTSSATLASRFAGASPNHSISTVMPSSGVRPHIQQYYPPSVSSGFGSRRPSAETSSITSTASGPAQLIHHSTSDPSMNPGPAITATGPPPNPGTSVPKKKGMFWIPQFRSKKENSLPEDVESPMATPIEQGSPLSSAAALRKAYPKDSSPSRDSPIARYQAQNAGKPLVRALPPG
ncbi:uncharacterized protein BJ171DRAFT_249941 [Polychytrium aggregatum]|uniref:uncharacterized protein n=1 Tax=Polychytrium aggregatum TaxID=110093 RepID=UPI0022FF08A0|nr:uncharacterized protein BJ171DRAFT_249941 [Polychytrium aggregatum]KAI9193644.1 hypothetical protein BJ171DRAFT_249941 [Polychytrium aggregatum]